MLPIRTMKPFSELTERGQLRRLRQLAIRALEHFPIEAKRIRLLANETNTSFRIDAADGTAYVLRISSPERPIEDAAAAETAWLQALNQTEDIVAPRPVPSNDGSMSVVVTIAGIPEPRRCLLLTMLPGQDLANRISNKSMHQLGMLTARLHDFAASFHLPGDIKILTLGALYPFGEPEVLFEQRFVDLYPDGALQTVTRSKMVVQRAIQRLYDGEEPPIVVHGDIHEWNVLIYRDQLAIIDHEDVMWGYPVQDIGVTFHYLQQRPDYINMRRHYRTGYESIAAWPEKYPGEIDIFVIHRGLHLMNYVLHEMSDNQELVQHFMQIPDRYWEPALDRLVQHHGA